MTMGIAAVAFLAARGRRRMCHDNVQLHAHQFRRQFRKALVFALRIAVLKRNVFALGVTEVVQFRFERVYVLRIRGSRSDAQEPYAPELALLLGEGGKRRCEQEQSRPAADEKLAARLHSITSSARSSSS